LELNTKRGLGMNWSYYPN